MVVMENSVNDSRIIELKESILKGELVKVTDKFLFEERLKCKDLCFEYNNLKPNELEKRKELLKLILNKTQSKFHIEQPFWCDYGYNIEIGYNFYANHNLVILDCNKVTFGDNVYIGPNCSFYCPSHPLDYKTRIKDVIKALPINVGNNVWIGGNVTILGGVNIGDGAVIGAGSVITKDVLPDTLVCGNPAKFVKQINQ